MVLCQVIAYKISEPKLFQGENIIQIEMSFQSDDIGVTKLRLPTQWTDADNLFQNISNIVLHNEVGQNAKILAGATPSEKYIIAEPHVNLSLSYHVIHNDTHHFKPHISKNMFSFIGKTVFITPELNEDDTVTLSWTLPNTLSPYHVVNSYGINQYDQTLSVESLLEGVFLGGTLYISDVRDDNNNQIIFTYNEQPSETQVKWEQDALALINAQRQAVGDNAVPYYLINTLVDSEKVGKVFSATHLKNSVLFVYGKNWLHEPREELIRITTHELFHYWIGHKIKASHDYLEAMWFFEGFNDFLSIEIAFKAGLLTTKDYFNIKNRILTAHYILPFYAIPNRAIALYYWDNPELHGIPYIKGHLFAQFCHLILAKHDKSLFDIITLLLDKQNIFYKDKWTETDLIDTLAYLISFDIYEAYVKYFINCEHFGYEIDSKIEGYLLQQHDTELPQYDFDIAKSFLENRVVGLDKESRAYLLGLREGQTIQQLNITPLLKPQLITMKVLLGLNEAKTISLKPHYHNVSPLGFYKASDKVNLNNYYE